MARARAFDDEHQPASIAAATQSQTRWTDDEDAVLIERHDAHAYVLARELRRTLYSVRHRRDRLRRRGLLP
ncbi:MAG: hypothetical protein H0W06_00620 [Chloroflexia bacterium]|nr:hypothetical protein [Chloroflexia bacterium]